MEFLPFSPSSESLLSPLWLHSLAKENSSKRWSRSHRLCHIYTHKQSSNRSQHLLNCGSNLPTNTHLMACGSNLQTEGRWSCTKQTQSSTLGGFLNSYLNSSAGDLIPSILDGMWLMRYVVVIAASIQRYLGTFIWNTRDLATSNRCRFSLRHTALWWCTRTCGLMNDPLIWIVWDKLIVHIPGSIISVDNSECGTTTRWDIFTVKSIVCLDQLRRRLMARTQTPQA